MQYIKCDYPEGQQRIESGPIQFNDDWPGYFLRGDNAAQLIHSWQIIKENLPDDLKHRLTLSILSIDSYMDNIQKSIME